MVWEERIQNVISKITGKGISVVISHHDFCFCYPVERRENFVTDVLGYFDGKGTIYLCAKNIKKVAEIYNLNTDHLAIFVYYHEEAHAHLNLEDDVSLLPKHKRMDEAFCEYYAIKKLSNYLGFSFEDLLSSNPSGFPSEILQFVSLPRPVPYSKLWIFAQYEILYEKNAEDLLYEYLATYDIRKKNIPANVRAVVICK